MAWSQPRVMSMTRWACCWVTWHSALRGVVVQPDSWCAKQARLENALTGLNEGVMGKVTGEPVVREGEIMWIQWRAMQGLRRAVREMNALQLFRAWGSMSVDSRLKPRN